MEAVNLANNQAVKHRHRQTGREVAVVAEAGAELAVAVNANHVVNLVRVPAVNVNLAERRSQKRIRNLWVFNPKQRELLLF